jgi:hypothetical protein
MSGTNGTHKAVVDLDVVEVATTDIEIDEPGSGGAVEV